MIILIVSIILISCKICIKGQLCTNSCPHFIFSSITHFNISILHNPLLTINIFLVLNNIHSVNISNKLYRKIKLFVIRKHCYEYDQVPYETIESVV